MSSDSAHVSGNEKPPAAASAPNESPYAPVAMPTPHESRVTRARVTSHASGSLTRAVLSDGDYFLL